MQNYLFESQYLEFLQPVKSRQYVYNFNLSESCKNDY